MYADDHQVYVSDNSIKSVQEKLNTNGEVHPNGTRRIFYKATKTNTM